MTSKAIARIVPIKCEEFDPREPFYVLTVNDFGEGLKGKLMDGAPYSLPKRHWKVEMLPVEWNGEGLPPVGTWCERTFNGNQWFLTTIVAHVTSSSKNKQAAFCDNDGEFNGWGYASAFRPIRSARDKAVEAMRHMNYCIDIGEHYEHCIYDAIAAGKIPGVKLDN